MRCGRFIIVVICVAGLLVGIQTYPDAVIATGGACTPAGSDDCDGGALAAVDWGILVIFTCEALLKIVAEHSRPWRYFFSAWNVFDFFIVAMCYVPGAGFAAVPQRHPAHSFSAVFHPFCAALLPFVRRRPASWRQDGENGRKMAENGRNLGEKRARNSGG